MQRKHIIHKSMRCFLFSLGHILWKILQQPHKFSQKETKSRVTALFYRDYYLTPKHGMEWNGIKLQFLLQLQLKSHREGDEPAILTLTTPHTTSTNTLSATLTNFTKIVA